MPIDRAIKIFTAASLLLLLGHALADPKSEPGGGDSDTTAQSPSESPTTQPGKTPAEGGDDSDNNNPDIQPFTPSETISADSAIAFPADI